MANEDSFFENVKVVKRNGSKVDFNSTKVAIAIKKGFDSIKIVNENDEEEFKYDASDIQKVYQKVINKLKKDFADKDKIKIEEIQDTIEATLKDCGYQDVYQSFSDYRERRAQSREMFMYDKIEFTFGR